jgi:hypothetical protein
MKKIIGIICCLFFTHYTFTSFPELRKGIANFGTRFPVLATVVANTTGPILEMGCGDYSTPMLHALCAPTKRMLVSTDVSRDWLELFLDLQRNWHTFIYVPAYEKQHSGNNAWFSIGQSAWNSVGSDTHWSVVLIDHNPGLRRVVDIERLRSQTDIFVVHDTEDEQYGYERVLKTFKYVYEYRRYHVTTTVVSDTIDVAKLFEL